MFHSKLTAIHVLENWSYANAAARTGATGFTSADLGKIAYQQDNGSYWRLTAVTPTWVAIYAPLTLPPWDASLLTVMPGILCYKLAAVNLNSANTDNAISIVLPSGFTRWTANTCKVSHASGSITTATAGIFSGTGGTGTTIVTTVALSGITQTAENTAANVLTLAIASGTTSFNLSTIYFRVGTAQGSAMTADVNFFVNIIP